MDYSLTKQYIPYAQSFVSKNWLGYGVPKEDLVQEAILGMMAAEKTYNGTTNFSTWSYRFIKSAVSKYVMRNVKIVTPKNSKKRSKLFYNIRKHTDLNKWINEEKAEQISKKLDVPKWMVYESEQRIFNNDLSYIDEYKNMDDEDNILDDIMRDRLYDAMKNLTDREIDIILHRWLVDPKDSKTLKELATQYGISHQRIAGIEKESLKKLRQIIEGKHSEDV